jgi:hypothetical protein
MVPVKMNTPSTMLQGIALPIWGIRRTRIAPAIWILGTRSTRVWATIVAVEAGRPRAADLLILAEPPLPVSIGSRDGAIHDFIHHLR